MSLTKRFELIFRLKNTMVHSYSNGELVCSRKNEVFAISDLASPRPRTVKKIPWKGWEHLAHIRFLDRYFKYGILQVHRSRDGRYLVLTGGKWWLVETDGTICPIAPPAHTRPMNRGICESDRGKIYVSEYIGNPERKSVRIFVSSDLKKFEVAWEFLAGSIRHVHAIIQDPEQTERIWVLTGDTDQECKFFYTDDEFKTLNCFLQRGQESRATDLIVRQGKLIWGMDSPEKTCHIMELSKTNSEQPSCSNELPGPVYYFGQNQAGGLYAGTTVEPGPAVRDNQGHLFAMLPDGRWEDVLQVQNDMFPQNGIIYFPKGVLPDNYLVFSQRALKPFEGYMTIVRDLAWG